MADESRVTATMFVLPTTPVRPFDRPDEQWDEQCRVTGLHIGELTLHFGVSGGDPEIIAAIDRLIEPLQMLRAAAARRRAQNVTASGVGIHGVPLAEVPA